MLWRHIVKLITLSYLLASFTTHGLAQSEKVSRRNIDVSYGFKQLEDGFGNVRKIAVAGTIQNNSNKIASKVNISFNFLWKNRTSDVRKIEFQNLLVGESQKFDFFIELGTQPDMLKSIFCNIDQIKFTNTREASPLTPFNLVAHELYSLSRLNEEGKAFLRVISYIREIHPFIVPKKDEFETTNEYENRVNNAENMHFSKVMDELEVRYGQLLGGANAKIRFLPRTFRKNLVYLSESSAYFHVPIRFGRFNADLNRFEDIAMFPRTFPFPPQTFVPEADLQFIHKSGMFFLRKTEFSISRQEAIIWREQENSLILEATIRLGVIQEGPYFQEFCLVEQVLLKNRDSGKVFREWIINP